MHEQNMNKYMALGEALTAQTPHGNFMFGNTEQPSRPSQDYAMSKQPPKGPPTHHVVPNPGGGWDVKKGGASRASSHHEIKSEAVKSGREVSQNQGTEFRVHNKDGKIASSDSHGKDPNPPKG